MNSSEQKMTRKNGIDLFKLIGAFFIMCLHISYGNLNSEYVNIIRLSSRWAVPFFFITTGYFLGRKIKNNNLDFNRIKQNISMLISILIISSIIYLPTNIVREKITFKIVDLLTGGYLHIWFIGATLTGYLFVWYLYYIKKSQLLPYLSIIILFLALVSDSYDLLFGLNFSFKTLRFLLSIPFIYIGILISKKETKHINNKLIITLIFLGFLIQFIEAELLFSFFNYNKHLHQFLLGTIIVTIPLFIITTKLNLEDNLFSKWGKDHSLFIYLYHPIIYNLMISVLSRTCFGYYNNVRIFSPLIGFSIILTLAITLNKYFPKIYNTLNGKF